MPRGEKGGLEGENLQAWGTLSCNVQQCARKGIGHNVEVPGDVKDAEIDVLFEEDAAREEENRIVSPKRLERIEDLNSIKTVSEDSEAPGNSAKRGSIFNGRGNTKCLKPKDGVISGP